MTLFDVEELCAYWQRHPPIHLMLAAFLGIKSDEPAIAAEQSRPSQVIPPSVAMAAIPGLTPATDVEFLTPIFDVAELMRQRPN